MKEVTDTSRHGVVLALGLRRRLRFLAAPLIVAVAAHGHPAPVIVHQGSHRPDAGFLDAAQIRLHSRRQHAGAQRLPGRDIGARGICDDLGEAGGCLGRLEELRSGRQRGEAVVVKPLLEIFERRDVMLLLLLLASRVFFQNVAQDGWRRRRGRWTRRRLRHVVVILQRQLK